MDGDKLAHLVAEEGFHSLADFCNAYVSQSRVPGICCNPQNPSCNYITLVASDEETGLCGICRTKTVISGLKLAHLI